MNDNVPILAYIVRFTNVYAIAVLIMIALTTLLGIEADTLTSILSLIIGVVLTAHKFVADQRRVPGPSERRRLTVGTLIASLVVSTVITLVFLGMAGQLGQVVALVAIFADWRTGLLFAATTVLILALHTAVIWFVYGASARSADKSMRRRQTRG